MKNRKMLLIVSLVLAMTMSLGGTLAYLTDTDADVNVMTVGRVSITQNEQDRDGAEFQDNQPLIPIVKPTTVKDEDGIYPADENYIDKIVTVKNTGTTNAWVRTLIAIPTFTYEGQDAEGAYDNVLHWQCYAQGDEDNGYTIAGKIPGKTESVDNNWSYGKNALAGVWPGNGGEWNTVEITVNGIEYTVYIATNLAEVTPGETTAPNMTGLYLDSRVDYDNDNGYYTINGKEIEGLTADVKIPVLTQAVQASGFDTPWEAFKAAFNENEEQPSVELVTKWISDLLNVKPEEPQPDDEDSNVYEIGTAAELLGFANMVNGGESFSGKTVVLTADIDLANQEWTPIGQTNGYYAETYFQGTFDGQGHTISNLSITNTNESGNYAAGFFGFIDAAGATIKNVKFDNATVKGHHWTAVVVGFMSGTVSNCQVTKATVTCTHANNDACGDKAGVIIGYLNDNGHTVTGNSATNCTVTAGRDAGAIIGAAYPSTNTISNNTFTNVTVSSAGSCTGANIRTEVIGRELQ